MLYAMTSAIPIAAKVAWLQPVACDPKETTAEKSV